MHRRSPLPALRGQGSVPSENPLISPDGARREARRCFACKQKPALAGLSRDGRYWVRTSDPQLVEPTRQLDPSRLSSPERASTRLVVFKRSTTVDTFGLNSLTRS